MTKTHRFIYELQYHPVLEHQWVYGGEYTDFTRLVESAVRMWLAVGFELHFVFDGAYPLSELFCPRLKPGIFACS
jgi:hypothetical protein